MGLSEFFWSHYIPKMSKYELEAFKIEIDTVTEEPVYFTLLRDELA